MGRISRLLCASMLGLSAMPGCKPEQPALDKGPPAAVTPEGNAAEAAARQEPGDVGAEDVQRETGEAIDASAQYARQQAEQLRRKLQEQIDELDVQIERLKAKGEELKEQAQPEWNRRMAQLEEKRQAAQRKLDAWQKASPEAWQDLKRGASNAWTELEQAYQDASRHFSEAQDREESKSPPEAAPK